MVELGIQRQRAHRQYEKRDVRIEQEVENALLQRHRQIDDGLPNQMERDRFPIEPLDWFAIELLEQVVLIAGYVINQVQVESFLVSPGLRLAYRGFRQRHIASSETDERTHKGSSVVFELLLHYVIQLLATQGDRMRRSGIGSRSHGSNVGGFEDEESCRSGPRAC